jgi:glycosyltransferase involved in cell wall biosynthesis
MKKLIIFMPSIEGGGVEKNLFIISNYLALKLKKITLITASHSFNNYFNKNIEIINPRYKFWDFFSRRTKYFICLTLLLKIILFDKKITILAFQANIYCILLSKIFNIKIITRSNSSPSGWSKSLFKNIFYKKILNMADKVIVNSQEFKQEMKIRFSLNTECIYNPLNKKEIFSLSKKRNKFNYFIKNKKYLKILTIGRFVDQKDQITILKALNILNNKLNFRMLIMGKGTNERKLNDYIIKNNLKEKVKLIGFQKNPYKFIKLCDLFILSSLYEGLPNVLLESICLKKFIISTNCPTGPKEILSYGKGGSLYHPKDYYQLAKLIEKFYNKKLNEKNKIKHAYNALYRFDYKKNLNKYLNLVLRYL